MTYGYECEKVAVLCSVKYKIFLDINTSCFSILVELDPMNVIVDNQNTASKRITSEVKQHLFTNYQCQQAYILHFKI